MAAAIALAALLAACARTGFPEGGPLDDTPPAVVSTLPADRATGVPRDVQIEFVYDEPLAPAVQELAGRLVFFNPDRPEVVTNAGGKKIEIQPRSPLEPETTYTVVVNPGLPDRRTNLTKLPARLVFSTGGDITLTLLKGTVASGGEPVAGASVRAFNQEREFGYRAFTDSSGAFELRSVALGKYVVTAWNETNGEEGFQYTLEAGDSAVGEVARVGAGLELEMNLVLADTSAARLVRVEPVARDGLLVAFSDTLARDEVVETDRVAVLTLPPEVAPRGTPLDSVAQSEVRGLPLPVEEVIYDTLEPKSLLLELGATLADSTAYAVRVGSVKNAAGLVAPEAPPWLLFRTRVVPDSLMAREPAEGAAPSDTLRRPRGAPADTVRAPRAAPPDTVAPSDTVSVPRAAPPDTIARPDTVSVPQAAPTDTVAPSDTAPMSRAAPSEPERPRSPQRGQR